MGGMEVVMKCPLIGLGLRFTNRDCADCLGYILFVSQSQGSPVNSIENLTEAEESDCATARGGLK
jgi:hypothetical protein